MSVPVKRPTIPARFWIFAIASIFLAHVLDPIAFRYLRIENVYGDDFGRMLRVMGYVPLWLAVGAALMLEERTPWRRMPRSRGGLIIAGSIVGGAAAEFLKLILKRRRPGELGEYVFRPFAERTFSTGGLGMPSSHALVAFGAAAVLSRVYPRARIVWWGLAWGCGLSRVAAGAHFLSDVVVAACIGWLVGAVVWRWRDPATDAPDSDPGRTPATAGAA
ncbi:MAG: phosphatase PAP2 family protein [Gemmatimonadetes bacterium]|nr:phosphatase PAP2 family protein [Gemmatimonadota bacterium]